MMPVPRAMTDVLQSNLFRIPSKITSRFGKSFGAWQVRMQSARMLPSSLQGGFTGILIFHAPKLTLQTKRDLILYEILTAFRESELRFRALADHFPVLIWVTNAKSLPVKIEFG
jgi:hypothetical protein